MYGSVISNRKMGRWETPGICGDRNRLKGSTVNLQHNFIQHYNSNVIHRMRATQCRYLYALFHKDFTGIPCINQLYTSKSSVFLSDQSVGSSNLGAAKI